MIYVVATGNSESAFNIVYSALERSCGHNQVRRISINQWIRLQEASAKKISVFINPAEAWSEKIIKSLQKSGNKTLLLGALSGGLAKYLDAKVSDVPDEQVEAAKCLPAPIYGQASSDLKIHYNQLQGFIKPIFNSRACLRYDFTDEWNNLGFGAVRVDGSIWAISQTVVLPFENTLANLVITDRIVGSYAGAWLKDLKVAGAALWFNRQVGPVDSQEWRLVEQFLSEVGFPVCACQPVLSEIPYGYDAVVTMRLDCDEDIESARSLWQAYNAMRIPFSLALHSKVLDDPRQHILPREVLVNGGALLSHTATHAPDWGGSYEAAYAEASISADKIIEATGHRVRYAVSPFHQTPAYSRGGLADAGYDGCIGGIIRNDYDFLMARSGVPPWSANGFIGHSQQCMLHGDCMLDGDDPLAVYKEAFQLAKTSRTFFGYLDHPFSERYQYGWKTEAQRIQMHEIFIDYIRRQGNILFLNENDAMDFMHDRSKIAVLEIPNGFIVENKKIRKSLHKQSIEFGGIRKPLTETVELICE